MVVLTELASPNDVIHFAVAGKVLGAFRMGTNLQYKNQITIRPNSSQGVRDKCVKRKRAKRNTQERKKERERRQATA